MIRKTPPSFTNKLARLRGHLFRLKCSLMRSRVTIGKGLLINKRLEIRGAGRIEIGDNCEINGVMGDTHRHVTLYTYSENALIKIGNNVTLCGARVSSKFEVNIGNDVLIEQVGILDTDFHTIDYDRQSPTTETTERCRITIGDRSAIGIGSIIVKGVTIGHDAIIAPGSIVTSDIPDMCFAAGNPAKVLHRQP